jgi:lipoate-protein ligase A
MFGPEQESAYPPATWRLIVDGEADGATNMAVDAAILESVIVGASPPTLRFYGWSPPCLSLGRSQRLVDADLEACRTGGVDVVRRPTGGRSILHTDELTYSVALLQADPRVTGDVVESYRRLSEGLLAGLHLLGADAVQAVGEKVPRSQQTAVCFESPSSYEIVVAGRKLVGSAQWRARGGALQHGTLPLVGDITRVVDYLSFSEGERQVQRRALAGRATTLEETLGRPVGFSDAAQALARGFAQSLNLFLVPGDLTAREREAAAKLRQTQYAASDWTSRA